MSPFKLKVVGGDLEMTEVTLNLPATLGRAPDVSLSLMHPLVSRHHCELFLVEGNVHVRDLGSLNGTFVGSQRIDESLLRPGDLLTVGTVTFRADYAVPPVNARAELAPGSARSPGSVSQPGCVSQPAETHSSQAGSPIVSGSKASGQQVISRGALPADGRSVPVASPLSETEPLRTDLAPLPSGFVQRPVESRCEPS